MADLIEISLQNMLLKLNYRKLNCFKVNCRNLNIHGIEMALNKITSALMKTENGMLTLIAFLCREEREIMGN